MLSIGCIQAQKCHTDTCPTGVATQNAWLSHGLDPQLKSVRLANYVKTLRRDRRRVRGGPRWPHRVDLAPGRLPLPVRLGAPLEGRPGRDHRADDRYRGTGLQCTAVAYSRGVNRRFNVPMITDPTRSCTSSHA
jgi:hypothetical protein